MPSGSENTQIGEDKALNSLEDRIVAARKTEDERIAKEHVAFSEATGFGWTAASTMLGYPLGGIIVGFAIDQWLGTTPWVTIGLMFTAFFGALVQVVRINQNRN